VYIPVSGSSAEARGELGLDAVHAPHRQLSLVGNPDAVLLGALKAQDNQAILPCAALQCTCAFRMSRLYTVVSSVYLCCGPCRCDGRVACPLAFTGTGTRYIFGLELAGVLGTGELSENNFGPGSAMTAGTGRLSARADNFLV